MVDNCQYLGLAAILEHVTVLVHITGWTNQKLIPPVTKPDKSYSGDDIEILLAPQVGFFIEVNLLLVAGICPWTYVSFTQCSRWTGTILFPGFSNSFISLLVILAPPQYTTYPQIYVSGSTFQEIKPKSSQSYPI